MHDTDSLIVDGNPIVFIKEGPTKQAAGTHPGILWLGGFKSTMDGTKAQCLAQWAVDVGRACLRFDYSGHGASGGRFEDGTIGRWLDEAHAVFEQQTEGPQILVGSSMGGWISLLLLRRHIRDAGLDGSRIKGIVLIAPAADMTERLIWKNASPEIRHEIETKGVFMRPSAYDDGDYAITRDLIAEGRDHLLLGSPLSTGCPVRILHGIEDPDVPWQLSLEIAETLTCDDLTITLVKDGDHRLSTPANLRLLTDTIDSLY